MLIDRSFSKAAILSQTSSDNVMQSMEIINNKNPHTDSEDREYSRDDDYEKTDVSQL